MTHYFIDETQDIGDQIINTLEKEYGRSVYRVPKFNRGHCRNTFDITVIFTDYRLFEGKIRIEETKEEAIISLIGHYH